jgi:hypothetical protein
MLMGDLLAVAGEDFVDELLRAHGEFGQVLGITASREATRRAAASDDAKPAEKQAAPAAPSPAVVTAPTPAVPVAAPKPAPAADAKPVATPSLAPRPSVAPPN